MKKIFITVSVFAMLIVVACDTSKNSMSVAAPTTQDPRKPPKGEMKESDMKEVPQTAKYEKKALPTKGKLQPMEAFIEADSVVPRTH